MQKTTGAIIISLILVLVLVGAGCISPPKGTTSQPIAPISKISNPLQLNPTPTQTTPQSYVTVVTPFETSAPVQPIETQGYSVFPVPSPIPEDLTCLIYTKQQAYFYNTTAFSFNLKKPPMWIQYSVVPKYITIHKTMQSRELNNNEVNITYTDFSPDSWFLMTVRNKTTGEIYLTDGFGPAKGYPAYLDGTMKVLNRDDLLVEFSGNQITATARIYVKPFGNFEDTKNLTFTECKYFDVPREYATVRTAVPITTGTTRPPTVTRTPSLIGGYSHNTTGLPPGQDFGPPA